MEVFLNEMKKKTREGERRRQLAGTRKGKDQSNNSGEEEDGKQRSVAVLLSVRLNKNNLEQDIVARTINTIDPSPSSHPLICLPLPATMSSPALVKLVDNIIRAIGSYPTGV
ncbi:unnamed protein product [Lactuca virosa]|uniref:Uncharacterized protein n=1 Tax=Lactuca virosa TaxID=75947 RepID=A0AAU9MQF0_9ASTR|nr:unnamed protein product [Lactuca virosa]